MLKLLIPDYPSTVRPGLYEELNRRCTAEVAIQLDVTVWIPFSINSGLHTASLITPVILEDF